MKLFLNIISIFCFTILLFRPIFGVSSNFECTDELTSQVIAEKCFTFIQSISSWSRSYRQITVSDSTYWCHRKVQAAMENEFLILQKMVEERVKNTGTSHLTTLDEMIATLQRARDDYSNPNATNSTNIGEIAYSIRLGNFDAARLSYQRIGPSALKPLINSFYEKELKNAAILADFFETLPVDDEIYLGYRLLIEKLKENIQLYSTVTTTIGYRIRNETSQNLNLALLRSSIPESVTQLTFNNTFKIRNFKYNEALFAIEPNTNDPLKRMVFTYTAPACTTLNCQWTISTDKNGSNFFLKNYQFKEYLYADANDLTLDSKRHTVFLWKKLVDPSEIGRWEIEPVEDTNLFKIKNTFWNEYLYTEDIKYDKQALYRYAFTLRNDRCDHDGCKWAFEKI